MIYTIIKHEAWEHWRMFENEEDAINVMREILLRDHEEVADMDNDEVMDFALEKDWEIDTAVMGEVI